MKIDFDFSHIDKASKINGLSVVLETEKSGYKKNDSIRMKLLLVNDSKTDIVINRSRRPAKNSYGHFLIPNNANASPQFHLIDTGGQFWVSEAFQADVHSFYQTLDKPQIKVEALSSKEIGSWDLDKIRFIKKDPRNSRVYKTDNKALFYDAAGAGKVAIRWWDGTFQLWEPVFSDTLIIEIVESG